MEPPDFDPPDFEPPDLELPPDFDPADLEPADLEPPDLEPPDLEVEVDDLEDLEALPDFEADLPPPLLAEDEPPDLLVPVLDPEDLFDAAEDFFEEELFDELLAEPFDEPDFEPVERDPEPDDFAPDFELEDFLVVAIFFPPILSRILLQKYEVVFANNIPLNECRFGNVENQLRVEVMRLIAPVADVSVHMARALSGYSIEALVRSLITRILIGGGSACAAISVESESSRSVRNQLNVYLLVEETGRTFETGRC